MRDRPTPVIYKRFKSKKPLEWLPAERPPPDPARQAALAGGQHLVSRGIATPQNLAIIERTTPIIPVPLETFLVTIKAEDAVTLADYTAEVLLRCSPQRGGWPSAH